MLSSSSSFIHEIYRLSLSTNVLYNVFKNFGPPEIFFRSMYNIVVMSYLAIMLSKFSSPSWLGNPIDNFLLK